MKKLISIAVPAILGIVAGLYLVYGPNVLMGGPAKSSIIDVTRQVMQATAQTEVARQLATFAEIIPKGICSSQPDGVYACIVDVSVNGAPATSMVALLKKANGAWVAAER